MGKNKHNNEPLPIGGAYNMDEELQALMDAADAERDEQENGTDEGGTEGLGDHNNGATSHDSNDNEATDDDSSNDELDNSNDNDNNENNDDDDDGYDDEQGAQDDDNTTSTDGDDNDNVSNFTPIEVDFKGSKITINSQEELLALATKGISNSNDAPTRASENDMFVEQGQLSKEDLRTMIEAKAGNPAAMAKIAAMGNVDLDELDEDMAQDYRPQFELQMKSEVEELATEILRDETHATQFKAVSAELPPEFMQSIGQDAQKLRAFSNHIKSGLAQEVIPLVYKDIALNGGSFFDSYANIGMKISEQRQNTRQQAPTEQKPRMSKREEKMRNRANGGDKSNSSHGAKTEADDIIAMSDAEFEAMVLASGQR